jgi:hypothetical protein
MAITIREARADQKTGRRPVKQSAVSAGEVTSVVFAPDVLV